jgi:hypothetical protein
MSNEQALITQAGIYFRTAIELGAEGILAKERADTMPPSEVQQALLTQSASCLRLHDTYYQRSLDTWEIVRGIRGEASQARGAGPN